MTTDQSLAQYLNWRRFVDEGVIENHDGAFSVAFEVHGPDQAYADYLIMESLANQLNPELAKFSSGWVLQVEGCRVPVVVQPGESHCPEPTTQLVAEERDRAYAQAGAHYERRLVYTLTWLPPSDVGRLFSNFFFGKRRTGKKSSRLVLLEIFKQQVKQFVANLSHSIKFRQLTSEDLTVFLWYCVSGEDRKVGIAPSGELLNYALGAVEMKPHKGIVNGLHTRCVGAFGFCSGTSPQMLDEILQLPFDLRFSQRFIFLGRGKSLRELERLSNTFGYYTWYRGSNIGWSTSANATKIDPESEKVNKVDYDAEDQRRSVNRTIAQIQAGGRGGYYTISVVLRHADEEEVERRAAVIVQILNRKGFTGVVETDNFPDAFLGSLMGHAECNAREPRVTTEHLVRVMPTSSPWRGYEEHPAPLYPPHSRPLLPCKSTGNTPFFFTPRLHTLVIGPTECHAKGTPILMASGEVRVIEDIGVGDYVMGPDSSPRKVTAVHCGTGDMMQVVPVKGEPFTVSSGHVLSLVRTGDCTSLADTVENISVRDWLKKSPTYKHIYKLYRTGVDFCTADPLPIDPYLLGILIGDGCISGNCRTPRFTTQDTEIVNEVKRIVEQNGYVVTHRLSTDRCPEYGLVRTQGLKGQPRWIENPYVTKLKELGLWGKLSTEKHIPQTYKTAHREVRLRLLAGILDTDGSLSKAGYDYVSASSALANDVVFLARSLGFAAYLNPCQKKWQHGEGSYFRVRISGETSEIPCQVERKKAAVRQSKKDVLRTGFTVEPVGQGEYYGFECDGDHLYVMGDFTVTHNSGKTVLLNAASLAQLQYPGAQAFTLDMDAGSVVPCVTSGGEYFDLDNKFYSPLAHLDTDYAWCVDYCENLAALREYPLSQANRTTLENALKYLATAPIEHRTMSSLLMQMQDEQLRRVYSYYTGSNPGGIIDGQYTPTSQSHWLSFDMEQIQKRSAAVRVPVLLAQLHELDRRMNDKKPTTLMIDEGWRAAGEQILRDFIEEGSATMRKKIVSVWLVLHSPADLDVFPYAGRLLNNIGTYVFLPNPMADSPAVRPHYEGLGLGRREFAEVIAKMIPRRQYYVVERTINQRRVFELPWGPWHQALLGPNGRDEKARILELRRQHGPLFTPLWLEEQGHADLAAHWWAQHRMNEAA